MPQLFVSYKRGTPGLDRFMQRLNQASYAVWFDRIDIRVGDKDWQESINRGIENSDGLLLCLTEEASKSPFVRHEVQHALKQEETADRNFKIFPVLFEQNISGDQIAQFLQDVGLEERRNLVDLSMLGNEHLWEENFKKLLRDLHEAHIRPSRHDFRTLNPDEPESRTYRSYLRYVQDTYSKLTLDNRSGRETSPEVFLQNLFVTPSTQMKLVLKIDHYDITDWKLIDNFSLEAWHTEHPSRTLTDPFQEGLLERLTDAETRQLEFRHDNVEKRIQQIFQKATVYTENEGFSETIIQLLIQDHRRTLSQQKEEDQYRRLGRLDDVWQVIPLNAIQVAGLFPQMLFTGSAGLGKTIFAQYLLSTIAKESNTPPQVSQLPYYPHRGLTPLYISLPNFAAFVEEQKSEWKSEILQAFVSEKILTDDLESARPFIQNDLNDGRCLIVFDDLDQLYGETNPENDKVRNNLASLLNSCRTSFAGVRIILLARSVSKIKAEHPPYFTVQLDYFSPQQQSAVLKRVLTHIVTGVDIEESVTQRMSELAEYPLNLAGNPTFLNMMAHTLEYKYGMLYRRIVDLLLDVSGSDKNNTESLKALLNTEDHKTAKAILISEILAPFAYDTISKYPDIHTADEDVLDDIGTILSKYVRRYYLKAGGSMDDITRYISQRSGLFENYKFINEGFRRYFAAVKAMDDFLSDDRRKRDDCSYAYTRSGTAKPRNMERH